MAKIVKLMLLSCLVIPIMYGMNGDSSNNKKRKNIDAKESSAKRRKNTDCGNVCPNCKTEWLAQTDVCPVCWKSTGFGEGYDVINHKYFLPKDK